MASKSKKVVALILTAMMAVTALAGCGGDSGSEPGSPTTPTTSKTTSSTEVKAIDFADPDTVSFIKGKIKEEAKEGKVELVLWCSGDDLAFEKTLVKEFKEKFEGDGLEIKIKTTTKGEDEAGGAIIENAKKGGDVFSFADDQLTALQQNGAIASVAKYYETNVKTENSDEAITVSSLGDKLYAFPKTSDNGYFMYYDKRVFTDESDLESMDKMIEKAKAAGKAVYFNMGNAWYSTGFFFTAGCTIKYENKVQTATLGTPEGLAAAKAMAHICESQDNGFLGSPGQIGDNAYVAQKFAEGVLAAAVIGTWEGPAIKKELGEQNTGACKLPTVLMDGEQKQLHSFGGYKLIGVNVYSEYPFAAQTLAYFLSSKDSQLKRYETRGLIPTNKEAAADEKVKTDPAFKAIDDQRPFSHAQGTSVGAIYWGSGAGSIGGDLVTAKGKISDDDLMAKLKGVEANCKQA